MVKTHARAPTTYTFHTYTQLVMGRRRRLRFLGGEGKGRGATGRIILAYRVRARFVSQKECHNRRQGSRHLPAPGGYLPQFVDGVWGMDQGGIMGVGRCSMDEGARGGGGRGEEGRGDAVQAIRCSPLKSFD